MSHGNARIDLYFSYFKIGIGKFHPVVGIAFRGHQAERVIVSIQNDFQVYVAQQETFGHEDIAK